MELSSAVGYVVGLIILLIALQLLAKPLEWTARVIGNSIAGGLGIWLINLVGGLFGLHLGLNPVSALVVGVLGIPGLVALGVMNVILG